MLKNKRIFPFINNSLNSVLPGLANLLISVLVVRMINEETWGNIVELQLFFYIITGITAWGNKEYLLKEFSLNPAESQHTWRENFFSRLLLLCLPLSLIGFLLFDPLPALHLFIWIGARFITQSYESFITYENRFVISLLAELAALITGILLMFFPLFAITFSYALFVLSIMQLVKIPFFIFLIPLHPKKIHISKQQLVYSFPFFLLGITGFLGTKTDLYVVDFLLDKKQLGLYQVVSNLFILVKSFSAFALYPIAKNIFRMKKRSVSLLGKRFLLTGIFITITGLFVTSLILQFIYKIQPECLWLIIGFFFIIPGYWFSPFVFYLFKRNKQNYIVIINCAIILINAILGFVLIPFFSIYGALIASTVAQFVMAWLVYDKFRKLN